MKCAFAAAAGLLALPAFAARPQVPADVPSCVSPATPTLELWCEGAALWLKGEYTAARGPLGKALEMEKERPTLSQTPWRVLVDHLGISYALSGDLRQAKATFDYGVSKDPQYPMFYYNLACTYAEMNDATSALRYLKEAFARKAGVMVGEGMPDPLGDDSFKRFLKDPDFVTEMRKLTAAPEPIELARPSAERWLSLLDSKQYGECFQQLASHPKGQTTAATMKLAWTGQREPLGTLATRKLVRSQLIPSMEGLPGREGMTLTYEGNFSARSRVLEVLGLIHEDDGQWRVGSYITK